MGRRSGEAGDGGDGGGHWPEEGELRCGATRVPLRGGALRLILWIAGHQARINAVASESGQLWVTWKGSAIDGDIRTRL